MPAIINFEIRSARETDLLVLAKFVIQEEFSVQADVTDVGFDESANGLSAMQDILQDAIFSDENTSRNCYVAVSGEQLVGMICGRTLRLPDGSAQTSLEHLFVEKHFRRQGIATCLVQKLRSALLESGIHYINVNVAAQNGAAQICLERCGFHRAFVELVWQAPNL